MMDINGKATVTKAYQASYPDGYELFVDGKLHNSKFVPEGKRQLSLRQNGTLVGTITHELKGTVDLWQLLGQKY